MEVIFLDIDGVLNSTQSIEENYLNGHKENASKIFIPQAVFLINMLIEIKKVDVVISSTWRYNMDKVFEVFMRNSLDVESIIGRTPFLEDTRGAEIDKYLSNHKEISNFIIIDDDRDMEPFLNKLIHVDRNKGFTSKNYLEALRKFRG